MFRAFEAFVGLRYLRAKRRNHFISFISLTSIIGLALGVTVMITVLSVMNGFKQELTSRILGMASHATVVARDGDLRDWQSIEGLVENQPGIVGVAPYVDGEGMLMKGQSVKGTLIRGVLPEEEIEVSVVADKIVEGSLDQLQPGEFNIVLGADLAASLGVLVGDKVTLVAPKTNVTPAGILPRLKQFNVVGLFSIGMYEFDSSLALIQMDDAAKLFRMDGVSGLRLKTTDIMAAPQISRAIVKELPGEYWVVDWTQRHSNFFKALQTEKTVMFVILAMIIAVAAFNIVSTMIMVVTDKQVDIAVLRTLGASPRSIMRIFILQGTVTGLIGMLAGLAGGVWLALNVETIVPAIEEFFQIKFLSPDVYYISELPSDLQWSDVIWICSVAFIMNVLATIYPALRAARTQPVEALRYE
ncbi:MAG: lipoprotein-releasing ABC transporter permease subunit [Gammaproteobacteria bacterium]|nr:lipoprotein-releasing ABC transporter permease subunit [Gammaproteobacteria bacterium]